MVPEIGVQSQFEPYERLKKLYLVTTSFRLSILRYGSRVSRAFPGENVAPSSTPQCGSYCKRSIRVALNCTRPNLLIIYRKRERQTDRQTETKTEKERERETQIYSEKTVGGRIDR